MAEVFIALGSNLGDRQGNLDRALAAMTGAVDMTLRSAVHETEPVHVVDQPAFLNMVVCGQTDLLPNDLLRRLKRIEEDLGRKPTVRFGPRIIDLDILYYDDQVLESETLIVPHPRLAERRFVLEPLCEIAPDKRHTVTGHSTREMLASLMDSE